jgi:hypothetical protein
MRQADARDEQEAALILAAAAWLPTQDPDARVLILDFLRRAGRTGVDPIAALRDGLAMWFGSEASAALPASAPLSPPGTPGQLALEPLTPLRRPTLWPQRPKRRSGELFSSWLWRTAVAAGVSPLRFARDVVGTEHDDIDRDVAPATVRRLAQLSGQSFAHLAGGVLSDLTNIPQDTITGLAEDALLRDGRFLLARQVRDRQGRPRPVLQYCPRCLHTDATPHFRRGWRFIHAVVCVEHGCRLHDRCWDCGGAIAPLATRPIDAQPRCPACDAHLWAAPVIDSRPARRRQQALNAVLAYLVLRIAPNERLIHLDAVSRLFGDAARASVAEREHSLSGLRPANPHEWFGQPVRAAHADPLRMMAMGATFSRVAKAAAQRPGQAPAGPRPGAGDPAPRLSGRQRAVALAGVYSAMPRTLTVSTSSGQRRRTAASARHGVQSADQNR